MASICFRIQLHDAVYVWQQQDSSSALHSVKSVKPCAIADEGIVVGVSDRCKKLNITMGELLQTAFLKCADLAVEAPNYALLRRKSAAFMSFCARFGIVYQQAFDETLVQMEIAPDGDVEAMRDTITAAVSAEFGVACSVTAVSGEAVSVNRYSCHASYSEAATMQLAGNAAVRLKIDGCTARLFSLTVKEKNGIVRTADKRLEIPTDSAGMIALVLQALTEEFAAPDDLTLTLSDVSLKIAEAPAAAVKENASKGYHKKKTWDYQKENRRICELIREYRLETISALLAFLRDNPLQLSFDHLCCIAEKVSARCRHDGSYYLNPDYAAKLVEAQKIEKSMRLLVNGHCPLSVFFLLNDAVNGTLYYSLTDAVTPLLLEALEPYSPYRALHLAPAAEGQRFDMTFTDTMHVPYQTAKKLLVINKSELCGETGTALAAHAVKYIFDFGANAVSGTAKQFCALLIDAEAAPDITVVHSCEDNLDTVQKQSYITDPSLPCWVLYRNELFDRIFRRMAFGVFDVSCGVQIKPRDLLADGNVRIVSSSFIDETGAVHIPPDCSRISSDMLRRNSAGEWIDRDDVFVAPKTSSTLKVGMKPKGCVPNQSMVVLIPKEGVTVTEKDVRYYYSDEFRLFYRIALNRRDFLLSGDFLSLYFLGVEK